jgi:hypothetical protein
MNEKLDQMLRKSFNDLCTYREDRISRAEWDDKIAKIGCYFALEKTDHLGWLQPVKRHGYIAANHPTNGQCQNIKIMMPKELALKCVTLQYLPLN